MVKQIFWPTFLRLLPFLLFALPYRTPQSVKKGYTLAPEDEGCKGAKQFRGGVCGKIFAKKLLVCCKLNQ